MNSVSGFLADNAFLLFFLNGLAFFALGLAVALETRKASASQMTESLWLLSAYGFVASLGNWLQMFLLVPGQAAFGDGVPLFSSAKLIVFVLAASLLLQFAIRRIIGTYPRHRWLQLVFVGLASAYLVVLVVILSAPGALGRDWLATGETWARYLLYLPGMALAVPAMLAQRRYFLERDLVPVARDCVGAALAFGLKATVSGVIAVPILGSPGSLGLAVIFPLQVLRTLGTVAILYFILRILWAFELNRQRRLSRAIRERLSAQETALEAQQQVCEEITAWSASMADMVHTVSSAISQPLELQETMRVVLGQVLELTGLEQGAVFLLDEEEPVLNLVAHQGRPDWYVRAASTIRVGDGLAGWCAQTEELLIVDDLANDPRPFVPGAEEVIKYYAGVPLKARGRVVGVMNVSSGRDHELSGQQIALLDAVGQQLGVAIENSRLYQRVRFLATAEERSRLAREIHDSLSQLLGYLNLKAASAEELLAGGQVEQARDALVEVKRIAQDAYADARETIFSLRSPASHAGLVPALKDYLDDYSTFYDLRAELSVDDASLADFSADVGMQVSCIIQEALTNVRKHAGATRVWLRLEPHGSEVQISIKDNGQGFDLEQTTALGGLHFGLSIMRERAESVGGRLEVDSQAGEGTRVVVWMPRAQGE